MRPQDLIEKKREAAGNRSYSLSKYCLFRLLFLCCGFPILIAACQQCPPQRSERYCELRQLIKKNLHLSAHLVMAVDSETIEAVSKEVTEKDIPVLVELLSDEDAAIQFGAGGVLERFEEKALPALQEADRKVKQAVPHEISPGQVSSILIIRDTLEHIETRLKNKRPGN